MDKTLVTDLIDLLEVVLKLERDEDSSLGMCFVEGRVSEDWFYHILFELKKIQKNDSTNQK